MAVRVKELKGFQGTDVRQLSQLLEEQVPVHLIESLNWEEFPYQPKVSFRIAYANNNIVLKYYVTEEHVLAKTRETNGPVHQDSCVEFFFDPLKEGRYYNFEVNAIGTVHLAYGSGRSDRQLIAPKTIEDAIVVESSLGTAVVNEQNGQHFWEMILVIPASILVHHPNIQLKGLTAKANFYKCGDLTAKPHYLSYYPVNTAAPDYHRPEFFGDVLFE
ncbi:Carbohydrate-binding family 9 [Arenibacter nanhaiticus]|uniref:Carbohydrate-binding family 9 n=1 Tax=Arenibacter nanhaiticus TaxID=558155 RepID=A0A1M6CR76_9FLAO|nr:carbohydrate-binding family 9-like protein [Arenibacter nanhaiticus]SHI63517.1 Carbohydrate-binding family 9 [Arenibacter nanhaiticus]